MSVEDGWRIGVDIGGTFTDLALAARGGGIEVFKVATVPDDPTQGVIAAIGQAAASRRLTPSELIAGCALFVHGSTIATNTLLEGKGARIGLLATEGFRDSLEIRRGKRDNPWDHRTPYAPVLVPRYLRQPVRGRIDRNGCEVAALNEDDIDRAAELFRDERVEAVAIALFNSFLNPDHERAVAACLASRAEGLPISLSSAIAPIMGEYERTSTAVLNAYVAPRTLSYLRALNARLAELGLRTPLVLVQSNGGAISVAELGERSVTLLLSGPAAGASAMRHYAEAIGSNDLVSIEIGGTSCDVILMRDGKVPFTDLLDIGGYQCAMPSIDVHTIGAGGGTIARVDAASMIQVGPQGAGAMPGPACYGRGGVEPTITDAQVALGRLKAGAYARGAVTIDRDLAHAALDRAIATPLGLTVDRAAAGVIQLMDQKLLHAVQHVSSERGHNPEHLTLVAAGGAGPLHAVSVARALGCRAVYVPRLSGAFCALGMLNADLRHDYLRVWIGRFDALSLDALEAAFDDLAREAKATLAREGFADDGIELRRAVDLRYLGQQWDVTIDIGDSLDRREMRRVFEAEHDRLFGHVQPDGIIELTKLRIAGIGRIAPLEQSTAPEPRTPSPTAREVRPVWIDEPRGWRDTPVYDGADLGRGHVVLGPAIVDEDTTTLLIGAGDRLSVDASGNYRIELAR